MIVDDFHPLGALRLLGPLKADAPLVVDSDRVLTFSVAFQIHSKPDLGKRIFHQIMKNAQLTIDDMMD